MPVFEVFDKLAHWVSDVCLVILLALLVLGIFVPSRKNFVGIILTVMVFALADQMRIQPWVYFFVLMLLPFALWKQAKRINYLPVYTKWIFVAVYFWSGLHKLNPAFYQITFMGIVNDFLHLGQNPMTPYLYKLAPAIGLLEMAIALLLLLPYTRRLAAGAGIASHLFIITYLSVFGIDYNTVVLPWNVCMILTLLTLYVQRNARSNRTWAHVTLPPSILVVLCIVWFLPAYNYISGSAHNFAFSLYSGKAHNYFVVFDKNEDAETLQEFEPYFSTLSRFKQERVLNVHRFALGDLQVPFYPSNHTFRQFARKFCEQHQDLKNLKFVQLDQLQREDPIPFTCEELGE